MNEQALNPPPIHKKLKPSNMWAGFLLLIFLCTTVGSLYLSLSDNVWIWLGGQLLFTIALLQWFVLLHECGHNTFFSVTSLNVLTGHLASVFAVIPFHPWQSIHSLHHKWTGWQDKDPTTDSLVPRELATHERLIINFCWKFWIPLFSILYRTSNYWNLPRLNRYLPRAHHKKRNTLNIILLFALYLGLFVWLGSWLFLKLFGLGFFLSLVCCDPILFSQHNHIPQKLSKGEDVRPHPPQDQVVFTRSLVFPGWFSLLVLLHFDAHELHHKYPQVPGYLLHRIDEKMPNEMHWLQWILAARRVPAATIMFKNRNDTGLKI